MATSKQNLERLGGERPDLKELKSAWRDCIDNRTSSVWHRQRLNWEARYTVWANQSPDGRKWPKDNRTKVWPWKGASDVRLPLIDKYIREDVALLMAMWTDMKILVRPNAPARDADWSNRMTSLLRWLVYEEMEESEDEAELLANMLLERGSAALGIWWRRTETLTRQTIKMEELLAAAEQAQQRLQQGQGNPAVQLQALLPQLILDPTQEEAAVKMIGGVIGNEEPERVRRILRELRSTGEASYPRPIVSVNRPELKALAWNEDIWTPPDCADLQKSRQVFTREWLSGPDLKSRAKELDWDTAYTDKVLETQRGKVTELTQGPQARPNRWNAMGVPDASNLYEIVTAYERLADRDGVIGIYCTPFSPGLSDEEGAASTELLDYAHDQYPFVPFATERRSRLIEDARGYGEVGATWQAAVKKQWDARTDRTDVATLPPSHHPPGEEPDAWGPGVRIPTMQSERFGYFETPKYDLGSKEIEETVRKFSDEYFGRPVDEQNKQECLLLKRELVRKWFHGWKRAHTQILQLSQQYLPDDIYFRVVGDAQGRGIRTTREEIQGPFAVSLRFNIADVDQELVAAKLGLIEKALAMDANAIVDRNEAIKVAFELIDPGYAERLVKPAEAATLGEIKDEQDTLAKLLLGIQVDVQGNEAFALRREVLGKLIQSNPLAQAIIQRQPQVAEAVQRRVKQLDFNIQQKMVNPEIGRRLGTKPNEQLTGPQPMSGLEGMEGGQ